MDRIEVVSAIIARGGLVLMTQRDGRSDFRFAWESPGGKVEPRETPRGALQRELLEELDINATIGDPVISFDFNQPTVRAPLRVTFYIVTSFTGEPKMLAAMGIGWFTQGQISNLYNLAPANEKLVNTNDHSAIMAIDKHITQSRQEAPFRYTGQARHEMRDK